MRTVAVNFLFALIALTKGKARIAVIGVFVPFVALFGAIRLARPDSPWARRFYRTPARRPAPVPGLRAYRHDRRWVGAAPQGSRTVIGGAPEPLTRRCARRGAARPPQRRTSPHSTSTASDRREMLLARQVVLDGHHLDDHRRDHQRTGEPGAR